ncbi:alpha-galactosidase [Pontixanthobacter sp.]|uniref:alpha-galactosidase n=1 Tax=Pontixanthobacter sp. TaxID=2792078 RepID=UPI003C7CF018
MAEYSILRGAGTLIVLRITGGLRPAMLYAGPDIPGAQPEELALLQTAQHIPGGPQHPIQPSLLNPLGSGWPGTPGLMAHRSGQDWAIDLRVNKLVQISGYEIDLHCADANAHIAAVHHFALCQSTGVLSCSVSLSNTADSPVELMNCAAICLPVDTRLTTLRTFGGKWADEFGTEDIERFRGSYVRENRAGRTSHANFPGLYMGSDNTREEHGLAAAFHLGWSGNSQIRLDTGQDGSVLFQAGELLLPGEVLLTGTYRTPTLHICWSDHGYGDVTRRLQSHLRQNILPQRAANTPRPVHYNTWEAVYFDHSESRLIDLAEKAAAVGAERFVLDDGWFGGRRSDAAGLGDWFVAADIYPSGLHPIANRVRELGMEFGLWLEPEMVNPDSDLFRAHPDWVLGVEGVEHIASRHQLPLDLTKQDVTDYLFESLSALLREYAVDYIKWDMNRDIEHAASCGHAVMHQQTLALYALIDRLRAAHPDIEIESCASGGGRADYAILGRTDRIWTSDNNDARRRHRIMRGASHFFPLSILGNHVGPKTCHITGRMFAMHFRAASAIFGHMGIELDLADETLEDRAILAAAIALHKRHRALIHDGAHYRIETEPFLSAQSCVASGQNESLTGCAVLDVCPESRPPRLRFAGLDADMRYRTRLVWPLHNPSLSHPSIIDAADLTGPDLTGPDLIGPNLTGGGFVASGAALMEHGIQLPLTHPDTCMIFHSEAAHD